MENSELIEKETSVSEQIEKTSINIYTFSMLDEGSGIPMNFPLILGGENIITDENAKLKVEEAFGQLNLQSLFGFEKHIFRSVVYDTFHLSGDPEALTPNVYIQKAFTNNVYLFNYLSTPYSDLNIESTFEEIDFMSKALSGVFRRASFQERKNEITSDDKFEICKENVDHLGGFMHYKIFTERDFRERKTSTKKPSLMILGMFLELSPQASEYQCLGNCGLTFPMDDPLFKGKDPKEVGCPNGDPEGLVQAPPALKLENILFVLPPNAEKVLGEFSEEDLSPSTYLGYFTGVFMPRNIALTVNKLAPKHFQDLVSVPRQAFYSNKINFEDFVKIECNFRIEDSKVYVFASISDSRFSQSKYKDNLISSLTSVTLNRDI
ncbi:MAG: hypothetical protein D6732_13225, partial [Methanobacteriota archaeon]